MPGDGGTNEPLAGGNTGEPNPDAASDKTAGEGGRPADGRSGDSTGRGVLVVGYGNPLRSDDGLGWHAAAVLADDPRLSGAQVLWRHQLTPDLAADFSDASLVVLIDVNVTAEPGDVSVARLDPTAATASASSHHADPTELVALAQELWGASPEVFIVSAGAATLDVGETLSPVVRKALPAIVEAVVSIVAEHQGSRPTG